MPSDVTKEDIAQGVRAWLKTALSLSDSQVILADNPGPKPTPPYLTVKVSLFDNPVGTDFEYEDDSDPPQQFVEGHREDTVSVNCYGRGAGELLRDAALALRKEHVRDVVDPLGISIIPLGGLSNLSALVDTDIEERFQGDFWVRYRVTSTPSDVAEATSVEVEIEASDLTVFTIILT